jgi:GNAT superfamily N-acetyltransferase
VTRELGPAAFLAEITELMAVYAAAMNAASGDLPVRRSIMERHSSDPGFRALAVSAEPAGPVIAFAYGFRGEAGQWWHDVVMSGITAAAGYPCAAGWLADALEVAEVHVHPGYQHRGIGRGMLLALTAGRTERTAVLSTADADSTARRLYRGLGFCDLLTGYSFPGGGPPYAVMGAVLPLRDVPGAAPTPAASGAAPGG